MAAIAKLIGGVGGAAVGYNIPGGNALSAIQGAKTGSSFF